MEMGNQHAASERLLAGISRQQIRRGAFKSVADLEAASTPGSPDGTKKYLYNYLQPFRFDAWPRRERP
jgi:hypothetical protein